MANETAATRWWRREGGPKGRVRYLDGRGQPIGDERRLGRVRALRIPPAWTDVHIAPSAGAKLQAYGFDQKGRKQYIYHADWVSGQAQAKFGKLVAFVERLPHFRDVTTQHLASDGLGRERVLALVTRLINEGCFRVGGERYARENHTYGIATLTIRHCQVSDTCLRFSFRGKRGVQHAKVIPDAELVGLMRDVAHLRGKRLFQYLRADGAIATVSNREINAYIKEVMGPQFSAKDFRTWGGTLMAARVLAAYGPAETVKERKRRMQNAVRAVSRYLGNTPAIAKASYISPVIFTLYERGLTLADFAPRGRQKVTMRQSGYSAEEVELMAMLRASDERALPVSEAAAPALRVTIAPETPEPVDAERCGGPTPKPGRSEQH